MWAGTAMDDHELGWAGQTFAGLLPPTPQATDLAVQRAVRDRPDDEAARAAFTDWLADNGYADEADAVRAFWPAIS